MTRRRKAILIDDPGLRYRISLARTLGMTLGELEARMSAAELVYQQAYDEVLAGEAEHAAAASEVKQAVRRV